MKIEFNGVTYDLPDTAPTVVGVVGADGVIHWDCPGCGKTHRAPPCCRDGSVTGCETFPYNVVLRLPGTAEEV